MIKSNRNQLATAGNQYQGKTKKVLCVCSAGLLRSPTIASVLNVEYGYNTRAAGTGMDFALVPISEALVFWADLIVCAEESHAEYIRNYIDSDRLPKIVSLNIPDEYSYNDPELVERIKNCFISFKLT